jgi:hypothetical protein
MFKIQVLENLRLVILATHYVLMLRIGFGGIRFNNRFCSPLRLLQVIYTFILKPNEPLMKTELCRESIQKFQM